jgi:hypothetical protein
MKTIPCIIAGLLLSACVTLSADAPKPAAETPAPKLTDPYTPSGWYADAGLSLTTPDFNTSEDGYFLGVGYQITKNWGIDARVSHEGLDINGHAVQAIGGRLVARMPFNYLSPYTFLGGTFNLERDEWRIQPGAGIELGLNKKLEGLRLFAEGAIDANLTGRNSYLFNAGIRIRF